MPVTMPSAESARRNAPSDAVMSSSRQHRHLVNGEFLTGSRRGQMHRFDEFARLAILLAIGDEIVFEADGAPLRAFAQGQLRIERDQRRGRIADRRAVGDVAADRAHVAHLLAADALDERTERRHMVHQRLQRFRIGDAGADGDRVASVEIDCSSSSRR